MDNFVCMLYTLIILFQLIACVKDGCRPETVVLTSEISKEHRRFVNTTAIPLMEECWSAQPERRKTMLGIIHFFNKGDKRKNCNSVKKKKKKISWCLFSKIMCNYTIIFF